MSKEFILPLHIYYEDTDAGMERARTELLRNFQQHVRLQKNHDIVFCKGFVTIVCVDENIKTRRIMHELLEGLTSGN
jgi:acyl-CoA thioesterase FadM